MSEGCSCDMCKACCEHLPGIPLPEEIPKIAKLLNLPIKEMLERFFVSGWRDGLWDEETYKKLGFDDGSVDFVYPAKRGWSGFRESWGYPLSPIPCIFLDENKLCKIHESNPFECREVFGCKESPDINYKGSDWTHRDYALIKWKEAEQNGTIPQEVLDFISNAKYMNRSDEFKLWAEAEKDQKAKESLLKMAKLINNFGKELV